VVLKEIEARNARWALAVKLGGLWSDDNETTEHMGPFIGHQQQKEGHKELLGMPVWTWEERYWFELLKKMAT
jgi:hypothetical protein